MTLLPKIDRLGGLLVLAGTAASLWMPLVIHKPNRIAAGRDRFLQSFLDSSAGWLLLVVLLSAALLALLPGRARLRLLAAGMVLTILPLSAGMLATGLVAGSTAARVSLGGAFWLLLGGGFLLLTDALVRLALAPLHRLLVLAVCCLFFGCLFYSGLLNDLSVMREYAGRADQFWREAGQHLQLALGSVGTALILGLPLGLLCARVPRLRAGVLQTLSLIQTIPSIALFGLLMVPLAWLAKTYPLLADLGIRGIGATPALIALVLYALLPVVANTVLALEGVPAAVREAAFGMGFSPSQVLLKVDLPLGLPVILTGIRVVLVQSIGLVTIAGLIGGGGFGAFVFQGINQTATDLVLLGALPTVTLAFSAAVLLDALVAATRTAAP
jgi:osmoprotectant transport system permease protein